MSHPTAGSDTTGRADQGVPFDLLVRHGTVIDGTRSPRFDADVGVRDARIVFVGSVSSPPARRARSPTARPRS